MANNNSYISDKDYLFNGSTIPKYPNPFFDLANYYLPTNIKTLFRYCRSFFYTDTFLRNVIDKASEYPVTDVLYQNVSDVKIKEKYDTVLHKKIKIKSFLKSVGLDYYVYGNAFVSIYFRPKRFLKCSLCKEETPIENIQYKFKNYKFIANCPCCNASDVEFKIKDAKIKSIENVNLFKINPENVDVEYNPITGNCLYYYSIPNDVKNGVMTGNKAILYDIPEVFIQAIKNKQKVELDPKNLYHLKMPGLAENDYGWGKPMILPALKQIYYLQTLRRGNEAIANDHIVPKKAIYPASNGSIDPFTALNLGRWRSEIETQIKMWKFDPNHIGIFPIPIGYQELGGNGRMLMLGQEIKFLEESIINSLGFPLEFIKGGTTWTGSSISLRIVENKFLNYRESLEDMLNYFIIPQIASYLGLPQVDVTFKKFKMTDDADAKQLALQLNGNNKISDKRLLEEFGYDSDVESKLIQEEVTHGLELGILQAEKQAEAAGRGQVINSKYQAKAQQEANDAQFREKLLAFENEITVENKGIVADIFDIVDKYALAILTLPEPLQEQNLQQMQMQIPNTAYFVRERYMFYKTQQVQEQMNYFGAMSQMNMMMNPQPVPENKPQGEKVESNPDKHTGSKNGSPE